MTEVQSLGALNWDRILFAQRFADRGGETGLDEVRESVGGSACNTASWLAPRRDVAFNGYLGEDPEADRILEALEAADVGTDGVEGREGRTGQAYVLSDPGDRTIYVLDGVNAPKEPGPGDLLHMSSFFRTESLPKQAEIAAAFDGDVAFSPGFLCTEAEEEKLEEVLRRTDLLFVNEAERKALGDLADPVDTLAVTLGSDGCRIEQDGESAEVPAPGVDVVDTTGAGDAFAAGLIDAYLDGASPKEMGRRGNEFAAECVGQVGGFREAEP